MKQKFYIRVLIVLAVLIVFVHASAAVASVSDSQQIIQAVARVRSAKGAYEKVREVKAMRGTVLLIAPDAINDRAMHAVASLLDYKNDAIRYWVVEALGHFGSRAKFVAPKLLKILKAQECVIAETSSVQMIRDTMERIGTPAPPERKCAHFE
jgi:hypothetical protein